MAESWQIACINRINSVDPYERIERAGGPDGEGWTLGVDEIVAQIKSGTSFWVDVGGRQVDVVIVNHSGREYIKTKLDGDSPNTLLSLPECVD
jgi:hypothetical protein